MKKNNVCPDCGSDEFITDPFQYDIMSFEKGEFNIIHTECIDEYSIYCRECGSEVDEESSKKFKKVVLKK